MRRSAENFPTIYIEAGSSKLTVGRDNFITLLKFNLATAVTEDKMADRYAQKTFCLGASLMLLLATPLLAVVAPDTNEYFLQRLEQQEQRLRELESLWEYRQRQTLFVSSSTNNSIQVPTDDQEAFERLRDVVQTQNKELYELKKAIGPQVISGHPKSRMKIVGRVNAAYWGHPNHDHGAELLEGGPDGPQNQFEWRRLRFGVKGTLPANMEYRLEMEYEGGFQTQFRDCWLGWNDVPFLQKLLVGNQKRPYALDQLNSGHWNVFMERPFITDAFNESNRRVGIQSYGFSPDLEWNWRFGVFNMRNIQATGNYTNDDLQLEAAARIANTFWYDEETNGRGYGHWALSGSTAYPDENTSDFNNPTGPDPSAARFRAFPEARTTKRWLDTGVIAGATNYQLLGAEGALNIGPLQVVTEYMHVWVNRAAGFGEEVQLHGGYLYLSYFLTGDHMPWNRKIGNLSRVEPLEDFFLVKTCDGGLGSGYGAWQIAARYSYADFNDDDILGGRGENFTLGLNWYWTAYARLQLNWIHGRVEDNGFNASPSVVSSKYDILGTQFMLNF